MFKLIWSIYKFIHLHQHQNQPRGSTGPRKAFLLSRQQWIASQPGKHMDFPMIFPCIYLGLFVGINHVESLRMSLDNILKPVRCWRFSGSMWCPMTIHHPSKKEPYLPPKNKHRCQIWCTSKGRRRSRNQRLRESGRRNSFSCTPGRNKKIRAIPNHAHIRIISYPIHSMTWIYKWYII